MFVTGTVIFTDQGGQEIVLGAPTLEDVLDILAHMVKSEVTLVEISLEDNDGYCITLPVEAIDQTPFSPALKQLQAEWEEILNQHNR